MNGLFQIGLQNLSQTPGTILAVFNAEIDVGFPQFWSRVVVDMPMQVNHSLWQGNDWTVRKDQMQPGKTHGIGILDQNDPKASVKRYASLIMVPSHEIEFPIEQGNQGSQVLFFPQCQVAKVENNISRSDQAVPVFDNQILPTFRATAIFADVGMEEVGIRDQPGVGIKGKQVC